MAAINKPQPPNPENSGDTEARKLLRTHVGRGVKPTPPRTTPSNGRTAAPISGSKRSGGASISGGRG